MATATAPADFKIERSSQALGYNLPQKMGRYLALPMFFMALMFFAAGMALGVIRADEISEGGAPDTIATLQHLQPAFMFLGFTAVFAGISFAIARILGQFREGGGELQEATGRTVETLKMPVTAKLFLMLMMVSMVTILVAVVLHLVFAFGIDDTASSLETSEERFIVLEGIRRMGTAIFLFGILLGLVTIIRVLRFQATRMRQLPKEPRRGGKDENGSAVDDSQAGESHQGSERS